MKERITTRRIVEIAFFSAIVILFMATGEVPIFSHVGLIFIEIPIALMYIKRGVKDSIITIILSTVGCTILFGIGNGITALAFTCFVGLPLGWGMKRGNIKTILVVSIGLILAIFFMFGIKFYINSGVSISEYLMMIKSLKLIFIILIIAHAILGAVLLRFITKIIFRKLNVKVYKKENYYT
ncbi:DUF2232 domain-containing protein [uncultured Clostridium sp.]|uniref:DUF2232 domain-containing protein n=1 Tax=uncultured Clostridium sp. TaxID=59620 RepID=UPI0026031B9A|nr:DUF2232 domain-containing protein [uncultured Clostridium sp.]